MNGGYNSLTTRAPEAMMPIFECMRTLNIEWSERPFGTQRRCVNIFSTYAPNYIHVQEQGLGKLPVIVMPLFAIDLRRTQALSQGTRGDTCFQPLWFLSAPSLKPCGGIEKRGRWDILAVSVADSGWSLFTLCWSFVNFRHSRGLHETAYRIAWTFLVWSPIHCLVMSSGPEDASACKRWPRSCREKKRSTAILSIVVQ